MNDCSHTNSLVPINLQNQEYVCTKCGWHFKILHIENNEFDRLIKAKGLTRGMIKEALQEAIKEWQAKNEIK